MDKPNIAALPEPSQRACTLRTRECLTLQGLSGILPCPCTEPSLLKISGLPKFLGFYVEISDSLVKGLPQKDT